MSWEGFTQQIHQMQQCIAQVQQQVTQAPSPQQQLVSMATALEELSTALQKLESEWRGVSERVGSATTAQDLTERKLVREEVFSQANLLDALEQAVISSDLEGTITYWNRAATQLYGWSRSEAMGRYTASLFVPAALTEDKPQRCDKVAAERKWSGEFQACRKDGASFSVQITSSPLFNEQGERIGRVGIFCDITEHQQTEKQLRQSEEQLRIALDAARMGFWDWNFQTGIVTRSEKLERLFGWSPGLAKGTNESFLSIVHPEDREYLCQSDQRAIEKGIEGDIQFRIVLPDGNLRWIESKSRVFYDEVGKPIRMSGISLDITERKQFETKIQDSLREKEVLLQEIHHRVKNNLQVISSLLDLQLLQVEDPTMQEMIEESKNRIKAMALIHEELYKSQDFSQVDFAAYVKNFTDYLFQTYKVQTIEIRCELKLKEVFLSVERAIPCALIINELISNALKHAFLGSTKGKIEVSLKFENEDYVLIVKDDGIGLPINFDIDTTKSLGIRLVKVLAAQLMGTLELNRSIGTEFRLKFPKHINFD